MIAGNNLKLELDLTDNGIFVPLRGVTVRSFHFGAGQLDASHLASPEGWQQLIPTGGMKTARFDAAGLIKDQTIEEKLQRLMINSEPSRWRITLSENLKVVGPYQLSALSFHGEPVGELNYRFSLRSSGVLSIISTL